MNVSTSPQCDTVYLLPSVTDWSIITALASWQGGTDRRRLSVIPPPDSTFSHLLSVSLVSYSIDRRTDRGHLFNVYPMNGSVFLLKRLDRETTAWHNISVVATELSKSSRVWDCLHCSCDILIKSKTVRGEAAQSAMEGFNNKNQTPCLGSVFWVIVFSFVAEGRRFSLQILWYLGPSVGPSILWH